MSAIHTIAICSSTTFYKDVLTIEKQLVERGFAVLVPEGAMTMKKQTDFDPDVHKEQMLEQKNYALKRKLIDLHLEKIKKSDAILVVNGEKKGIQGYIGGNVLIEIAVAYFLKLPIFIWRDIDTNHPFADEVTGIGAKFINGDISLIK